MTFEETGIILATMTTFYTERLMPPITENSIALWTKMLADIPFNLVESVVLAWVATNKYPPTIADIRGSCVSSVSGDGETAEEAWGKIQEATLRYGHTQPKEAELFLGKEIWTISDRFGWQHFCMMPIDEEATYFTQFRNAFNSESKKVKENLQIPESIKQLLQLGRIVKQMGSGTDG